MWLAVHRRGADERGAVLVIFMLLIVSLLTVAGLVLDFGLVRADRRQNKSAADLAVAAGMRSLELGGYPAPFRGVCEAVKFLRANQPELASMTGEYLRGNGSPISSSDPCTTSASEWYDLCLPNTDSTWAWYRGEADGGRIAVDIKNGYRLSDGGFSDESLVSGDAGDADLGSCDHLAVIVREKRNPGFGRVVSKDELSSSTRSVGRITQSVKSTAVIALLLLERHDCETLTFAGTNSAVFVQGYGTHPGIIHSDSIGDGANCSAKILNGAEATITNASSYYEGAAILAEQAPLSADPAEPPSPGYVSVAAKSGIPGSKSEDYSGDCPDEILAQPSDCVTGSSRKGRINVDILYRARIAALRAEADTRTKWNQLQAESAGFVWYPNCGSVPATVTERYVFITCPSFKQDVTFTADNAEIVFGGQVSGSNNMTFENPAKIYIRDGLALQGGNFNVNTGPLAAPTAGSCGARFPSARSKTTKLVVANGDFKGTGGNVHLCGTMVLMGDGSPGGGSCPKPPAIPATNGVVPYDNCFKGTIALSGGVALDWTAPNATDGGIAWDESGSQPYLDNFEDLAFWTEASTSSSIAGGGANTMKGVFFLPNSNPFEITGNGGQVIQTDAQFIVRKLKLGGNGILSMRPNPNNSVAFPYFSGFTMVR